MYLYINSLPTVILAIVRKSVNRESGRSGVIPEPTVQSGWEKMQISRVFCAGPEGDAPDVNPELFYFLGRSSLKMLRELQEFFVRKGN